MRLHVIYRSVGSENEKSRPPFYDKTLALSSLLRAAEHGGVSTEILFVNDGPIPRERLNLMVSAGEVFQVRCGSNRASLRRALTLPRERGWESSDLVWFSEDDYLYRADALASLVGAARELRDADYFALYHRLGLDRNAAGLSPTIRRENDGGQDTITLGGSRWYHAASTTSTFGARVRTLLADEWLFRAIPFTGGGFDHATCLTLQGRRPFGLNELGGTPLDPMEASVAKRLVRRIALTTVRLALNVVALTRPSRARRILVAPETALATHMQTNQLAPGTNWTREAVAVADWQRSRSVPTSRAPAPSFTRYRG